MAVDMGAIPWYSPDPRGILPLDAFHVPSRLQRVIRKQAGSGSKSIANSSESSAHAPKRSENPTKADVDQRRDHVKVTARCTSWDTRIRSRHGRRPAVGGLYGVALGGAFFRRVDVPLRDRRVEGRARGARERARSRGFRLLDTNGSPSTWSSSARSRSPSEPSISLKSARARAGTARRLSRA